MRFLYENSVSAQGYLIVPFIVGQVEQQPIYSYTLLSELGHKGKLQNTSQLYASSIVNIIDLAKQHLQAYSDTKTDVDYFKYRYTYHHNLIIIHQAGTKYFYDHYPPNALDNIAAPKLFASATDCINWVKQGLEQNYVGQSD